MIYAKKKAPLNDLRYEQEFEYMFILIKGKIIKFNPILTKKEYKDNRKIKVCGRYADNRPVIGFASKKEDKVVGNIWLYKVGGGHVTKDKIAYQHPAIFPEQLAADHIYSWSNEGDLVYDPMAGSGTVPKMAIKMNRNWIASEISQEYCDIAEKRIKREQSILKLF